MHALHFTGFLQLKLSSIASKEENLKNTPCQQTVSVCPFQRLEKEKSLLRAQELKLKFVFLFCSHYLFSFNYDH